MLLKSPLLWSRHYFTRFGEGHATKLEPTKDCKPLEGRCLQGPLNLFQKEKCAKRVDKSLYSYHTRGSKLVKETFYGSGDVQSTRHLMCASCHSMCAQEIIPFPHHCNFYVCLLSSCRTKIRKQKANITTINHPTGTKRKKACVPWILIVLPKPTT